MLGWWQAVVLGLVEGVTEYLPVSSTGHLLLTTSLLGLPRGADGDALDTFLIVIQGGAILAVLALYWPRVVSMIRGLVGRDPRGLRLACHVALAFAPAAVVGLLAGKHVKAMLFGDWPVIAALAAGGLWMLWLGRRSSAGMRVDDMEWRTALGVGCFQVLALWPGTSRSMATIGGGMLLGLETSAAAEFSFLLGLPTLGAACLHELHGNLRDAAAAGRPSMFAELGTGPVLLGMAVATVSAMLAVRWLVGWLNRHGLAPFGWYRLAVAAVFAVLLLAGVVTP